MSKEVIIIGAGPGGLAAAIVLAASGLRVKILERLSWIGGRTSGIEAQGFKFDVGPTFFLYPRVLDEIFSLAGTSLRDEVAMKRLDPQYRVLFGEGGHLDCTSDIGRMEQEIARLHPPDAPSFKRFMEEHRDKLSRVEPCLQQAFLSWKDILSKRLIQLAPVMHPTLSVDAYLKRFFEDPRVRLAFCFQSKYLGMSPFRCPSLFSILSFLEYEYGVWHPMGGCQALTQALARVAKGMGVEILLDDAVGKIEFVGRRAVGVWSASGYHRADAVVMNADFARAISKLMPNHLRRKWSDEKIAGKKFSCSTFMMYLGVEGRYDLPHHSIYISKDYERNLDEIENQHVLSVDPSFYVQNASVTDSSLAPKGDSTLYVLVPVTHQTEGVDWNRERDSFKELVYRQLDKAGYGGVRDRVVYERIITPEEWDTNYEVHLGATFNLAHSLDQMLHLRPRNRFDEAEGMYLVGGGTHPGSGLPVIFESARISSKLLLEDLEMSYPEPTLRAPVMPGKVLENFF